MSPNGTEQSPTTPQQGQEQQVMHVNPRIGQSLPTSLGVTDRDHAWVTDQQRAPRPQLAGQVAKTAEAAGPIDQTCAQLKIKRDH